MTEEIEIKLKRVRNVMNNFEDLLCEDMQNEVDEIKEYIEKQQKELDKKDKVINKAIGHIEACKTTLGNYALSPNETEYLIKILKQVEVEDENI